MIVRIIIGAILGMASLPIWAVFYSNLSFLLLGIISLVSVCIKLGSSRYFLYKPALYVILLYVLTLLSKGCELLQLCECRVYTSYDFISPFLMVLIFQFGYIFSRNIFNSMNLIGAFFSVHLLAYTVNAFYFDNDNLIEYNLLYGLSVIPILPYIFLSFKKYSKRIVIAVSLVLFCIFLYVGSRAASGAILAFAVIYLFFEHEHSEKILRFFLPALILLILIFTVMYGKKMLFSDSLSVGFGSDNFLNSLNKPIYTGRSEIWSELFDIIKLTPFFGVGLDFSSERLYSDVIGRNLSAHSFFIESILRVGFIGLIFICYFILKMWGLFILRASGYSGRILAAYIVAIIVLGATSEIFLFVQDNYRMGLMFLILGAGVGGGKANDESLTNGGVSK